MEKNQMNALVGIGILIAAIGICVVSTHFFGAGNAIEDASIAIVKDELPNVEAAANAEIAAEAPEAVPLADAVEDEINNKVNNVDEPVAPVVK